MRFLSTASVVACLTVSVAAQPGEKIDLQTIAKIRGEGMNHSQVMDHLSWMTDVYGPRLTGSPAILQASDWAMGRMKDWGLANVHRETFAFGKGWALVRFNAQMIEPQVQPIIGYPAPWTGSTKGTVVAPVVRVEIAAESDFERYRGKLAGAIVLQQAARAVPLLEGPVVHHAAPGDAPVITAAAPIAAPLPDAAARLAAQRALVAKTAQFFKDEGVVAIFNRGADAVRVPAGVGLTVEVQRTDGGTIFPTSTGARGADAGTAVPIVTIAVEHYNRMIRVLAKGLPVKVELTLETKLFDESSPNGFNTIAEIPGTDPALKDEVVIIGAHFDSLQAGTGATDNAAGSAAMMEAMRILKAIGARPRRTIRLALWGGEEQGLLGSKAYVRDHFADPADMQPKPDHARVTAYFNSDNGAGRVRGIWTQGNTAAAAVFEQWMKPLADLGVTALGARSVGSTDHVSFDAVGLPGFQFMVDRLEYNSRTHHSNMDVYDRVPKDDLVQQAVVSAVFAYEAAMRDDKLPRKPLPPPPAPRSTAR